MQVARMARIVLCDRSQGRLSEPGHLGRRTAVNDCPGERTQSAPNEVKSQGGDSGMAKKKAAKKKGTKKKAAKKKK